MSSVCGFRRHQPSRLASVQHDSYVFLRMTLSFLVLATVSERFKTQLFNFWGLCKVVLLWKFEFFHTRCIREVRCCSLFSGPSQKPCYYRGLNDNYSIVGPQSPIVSIKARLETLPKPWKPLVRQLQCTEDILIRSASRYNDCDTHKYKPAVKISINLHLGFVTRSDIFNTTLFAIFLKSRWYCLSLCPPDNDAGSRKSMVGG